MSDVSTPSAEYARTEALCKLPRTLMGGTKAMRAAATTYLPQEAAESDPAYKIRLNRSTLFNGFRKTIKDMAGKVFAKPIVVGDDVPETLRDYAENIDLAGRNLDVFAYAVMIDGLVNGISYVLADMEKPIDVRVDASGKALPITVAEEKAAGRRPYLCHIKKEALIGWRSKNIEGAEVLTQVRIKETVTEDDGDFGEKAIEQIRVFDRPDVGNVVWRIYRKVSAGVGRRKGGWELTAQGQTTLTEITLCPVYINRTGFMTGEPPLEDLADINVAHWQSQSDQRNILHVARVPILFASGLPDDAPSIQVGAASMSRASDPAAKLMFVEHSGQAIGAGERDLAALEMQMQVMGLELLIPGPGSQTATGEAIDQAKMNAPLAMMAHSFKDALEQAFGYMAVYGGLGDKDIAGGSLTVNTDFGVSMRDAADLTALLGAVNAGIISRQTFWAELLRRGVLADGFSATEEQDRIDTEPPTGMIPPAGRTDDSE